MKKYRTFVGDFETTVYENQDHTEVWASALVELHSEDVQIFHSIEETFEYLISLKGNIVCYYHNLKFDGQFWLAYLINKRRYKQAIIHHSDEPIIVEWMKDKEMCNGTFKYSISDMGQWYTIKIRQHNRFIEFRDSLKLLPFSVRKIGKSFGTKHKKLDMNYKGYRYAGCVITDKEKEYIANDVLVVKEALEIMFKEGHTKLTIGSCCLSEFKSYFEKSEYKALFPDLYGKDNNDNYLYPLDVDTYGSPNAGEYIRKSYKGGWCYVVKGKESKIYTKGLTADVNSLYPSMMHSESGNVFPIGEPHFWKGNYIPGQAEAPNRYYFIRIKTRFKIKPNHLPCIQIKNNFLYPPREWLETSDVYIHSKKKYSAYYRSLEGKITGASVTLTLTQTDFALIKDHYDLYDFQILDGCYFEAVSGLFDRYIDKYKKIKLTSTGAIRELAKLFLNNLYGKMASNTDSSFKYAIPDETETLNYAVIPEYNKQAGYIPIGSAITSYARNFTIRAAQSNYYGTDKPGFIYADTDSIHCDLEPEQLVNVPVHPVNFCNWKIEALWDTGYFVRPKTYIEHVVAEDLKPIDTPYLNIKCAGMPDNCKDLFLKSMQGYTMQEWQEIDPEFCKLSPEIQHFISHPRTITDFNIGLKIPGKLMPKVIRGGVVLKETTYEMR